MVRSVPYRFAVLLAASAFLLLGGCSSLNPFSDDEGESTSNQTVAPISSVATNAAGSPANPYMWQATLEAVGFMPLQTVNEEVGKVATDWYIPPGAPLERFRVDVAFSSRALRAESIAIKVERQELRQSGTWYDVDATPIVGDNLIDSILARALVLRQEAGAL